jgi:hypothetical protein
MPCATPYHVYGYHVGEVSGINPNAVDVRRVVVYVCDECIVKSGAVDADPEVTGTSQLGRR